MRVNVISGVLAGAGLLAVSLWLGGAFTTSSRNAPVDSGPRTDLGDYWTDERMREAGSAMPTWNPLPAAAVSVGVAVVVSAVMWLTMSPPSGRPAWGARIAFALSSATATAILVPVWTVAGTLRFTCLVGSVRPGPQSWHAVLLLLGFAAFGASGALCLGQSSRWALLLVVVPLVLGLARFTVGGLGLACAGYDTAVAVLGTILGRVVGEAARRRAVNLALSRDQQTRGDFV